MSSTAKKLWLKEHQSAPWERPEPAWVWHFHSVMALTGMASDQGGMSVKWKSFHNERPNVCGSVAFWEPGHEANGDTAPLTWWSLWKHVHWEIETTALLKRTSPTHNWPHPAPPPHPFLSSRHDPNWGGGLFSNMYFTSNISPPWMLWSFLCNHYATKIFNSMVY